MNVFNQFRTVGAVAAALTVCACQTLPSATSPEAVDRRAALPASISPDLVNRSEVVAVVASIDSATDLEQKAADWGYALLSRESLDGLGIYVLRFDCPPGIDPVIASRELERLSPRADVGANHRYTLQSALRASPVSQAPRRYADALIEWPADGCETTRRIGIIDGRVDTSTPALRTASVTSRDFMDAPAGDEHGTAIAELLVGPARLRGATLHAASVIGQDSSGEIYSGVEPMLRALDWMVRSNVDVVNISLAGPNNRALERGIARAVDKGVVIVAAVGNSGPDAPPQYPAALPGVIAATAVDADLAIYSEAVRGDHVDFSAPGVDIFVGTEEDGRYLSGTSVAAPHVAAVIASDPMLDKVRNSAELVSELARRARDLGESGTDPVFGAGLLKASPSCSTKV